MLPPFKNCRSHPLNIGTIGEKKTYFDYQRKCLHLPCVVYQSCECDCNNSRCYEGLFVTLKPHKKKFKTRRFLNDIKKRKSKFKNFIQYQNQTLSY